eukprot:45665-Amphidinium_carterae.4
MKSRRAALGAKSSKKPRTAVKKWTFDTGKLDIASVENFLAPSCKIWSDDFCKRWQAFYSSQSSCSKSWAKYGHRHSLKLVLQWAWTVHEEITGEPCSVQRMPAIVCDIDVKKIGTPCKHAHALRDEPTTQKNKNQIGIIAFSCFMLEVARQLYSIETW